MRFLLSLATLKPFTRITLNYQYPLSAAIYKIIQRADVAYASFLHERGYRYGGKAFKFFTFSDLRTPFNMAGDRMILKTNMASLTICFHMPDAAENFIRGLFMDQQLEIADSRDKATFVVQQVTAEKMPATAGNQSVLLQPMSPVVVGRKNERGHYDYLSPEDADFARLVINNLLDKYAAASEETEADPFKTDQGIQLIPVFFKQPPRSRLLTIKAGTGEETRVRGYDKFRLRMVAPASMVALALDAGIGMHNAMGMGCVEVV